MRPITTTPIDQPMMRTPEIIVPKTARLANQNVQL